MTRRLPPGPVEPVRQISDVREISADSLADPHPTARRRISLVIVVNGVLVLVALVLLVIGIAPGGSLPVIYASIVASVLAFASLLVGLLQRRGTAPRPAGAAGQGPGWAPAVPSATRPTAPAPSTLPSEAGVHSGDGPVERDDELLGDEEELGGLVTVVPGVARYHVEGCPELSGQQLQELDVIDAREEGHLPCGTCRPDAVLAAEAEQRELEEVRGAAAAPAAPAAAHRGPPPPPVALRRGNADSPGDRDAEPAGPDDPAAGTADDRPTPGSVALSTPADGPGRAAAPVPARAARAVLGVAQFIARDATTRGAAAARRRAATLQQRRAGGTAPDEGGTADPQR